MSSKPSSKPSDKVVPFILLLILVLMLLGFLAFEIIRHADDVIAFHQNLSKLYEYFIK